jgi:putative oxidoreductase
MQVLTLTTLRVGVGVIMVTHGWLKLVDMQSWMGTVESLGLPMPGLMAWLAVAGELLGGAGLIVGLLTPIAAFGVLCSMVAAIATVHWGNGLLAQNNGFEYPLTLGLVVLYFIARGAGPLSVDAALQAARRRVAERRTSTRKPIEGRRLETADAPA